MNGQNNNSTNAMVNNISLQRMMDNRSAMHTRSQLVLAQNMELCPKNTSKAYAAKQEEWRRGCKLKRAEDGSPIPLGRESILAYVKAVSDICSKKKALGWNPNGVARGSLVRAFLDTSSKKRSQAVRTNFEDRRKNTLNDGYTRQKLEKISHYFLNKSNIRGCRDRLCFLISHSMLFRSQTGVTECIALVATITFGKTNQHGKIEYGSSAHHFQVDVCSAYEDRFTPIQYKAQHKTFAKDFKAVGLHTSKVTQGNCKSALNTIVQENISGD
ncbi:hypothetical protein PHYBLDRAFT_141892 [Phycomyces blakesleeanus NRRL 1555(-)]|uniref:Ndc10 domain-containing protein n=1 Tax=Phycomyces blakesleeanus (strain ATCC 8743b / DSM 1359 / FGSC 10004 / NBRC 33097 / NRRL 1555) TaxID=763407 RepID=A0A162UU67_PHYB8|nr:hypothetical protein PHYBLDRAFT_141892 [Phycomyces blakesleeanus NRRL 1555(-)]OAD78032.1 hypothetical protein PHYBLDRAFT_141892 [Phycomyces blakesleeanus NRRL 1555(-)]|eukprot:XP_018296072.1 hypothetical protein PHYBLDRAFT_141892 [Phycomyces blakesleeanus NRRL 1555(-)]